MFSLDCSSCTFLLVFDDDGVLLRFSFEGAIVFGLVPVPTEEYLDAARPAGAFTGSGFPVFLFCCTGVMSDGLIEEVLPPLERCDRLLEGAMQARSVDCRSENNGTGKRNLSEIGGHI